LPDDLRRAAKRQKGATVFAYQVRDPERYGVVDFDDKGHANYLEEKPNPAPSNWAVTGLYFYDNRVLDVARGLRPSKRGELEITDINKQFLAWGELHVEKLGRGIAWLDTGTHESLQQASSFIQTLQERQGLMAACLEEIAFHSGWITAEDVRRIAEPMKKNEYGAYLLRMLEQTRQTSGKARKIGRTSL
jgi:glucose-1-phosphate thymidylyltransferase